MRTNFTYLFLIACYAAFSQHTTRFVENHLIVKLTENQYLQSEISLGEKKFGIASLDAFNENTGISSLEQIGQYARTRTFLLIFQTDQPVEAIAQRYRNLGFFEYVEPDYIAQGGGQKMETEIIPNDTRFNKQWGLYNDGTMPGIGTVVADSDVDMELAWDIQTGDPNMVIAVSDSGLKMNHPDIASRIWTNPAEILNGLDDDGNGLIDDIRGWDYRNSDNDPSDDLGHGTNVAGIIGAISNNNSLFTGVNWNSKIMVIKVLGADNSATTANMANSVYYAADHGAKVFSMSIGGGFSTTMQNAVAYADTHNMLFVACMMNFNNNVPYYPAAYSTAHGNVIAVGSTNPDDHRTSPFFWDAASGSNYGAHLNVVAPGNYIYGLSNTSDTSSSSYWGGTSQATPLVAGIASLILATNPELSPLQVRAIIENTAQDQVGIAEEDIAGYDQYMGHGRVNAFAALQAAQLLATHEFGAGQVQEFRIVNPERNGKLQLFSKGQFPGDYEMVVNAIDGKLVQSEIVTIKAGMNTIDFNHPNGNYILTLKSSGYTKIFKVIKE